MLYHSRRGNAGSIPEQHDVPDLISVVVTTYNRVDALEAVLAALAAQNDHGFEVVIADDGSGPATAAAVQRWRAQLPVPLSHVWHPDHGFRAAEIRNRAILSARGDYCVFLDGDCIARADFIAAHRRLAQPGWFVAGNRVLLSRQLTAAVLERGLRPETWTGRQWIAHRLRGDANRLSALLRLPLAGLRRRVPDQWAGARSCNLGVWRSDLERVDAFDADFRGWGREDSDLLIRLLRAGVRRKDGRFATGVVHLWHKDADRAELAQNEARLAAVLANSRVRAQRGLSSLRKIADESARLESRRDDVRAPS
jgi:glycosyltransferase involved in cell wall biosynthesis